MRDVKKRLFLVFGRIRRSGGRAIRCNLFNPRKNRPRNKKDLHCYPLRIQPPAAKNSLPHVMVSKALS
jgi:hypothetical protein